MASEVRLPDDAPVWKPDISSIGPREYIKAEEEFLAALTLWVKARWKDALSGEFVKWPMADGYALYIIVSERPFQIAHVDVGDGWRAYEETIRGFRLADARRQVEADKRLTEFFDAPKAFYDTLRPGDVVHYSNGFSQYVRCEVVRATTAIDIGMQRIEKGELALKPIALVGPEKHQREDGTWVHGWSTYDLYRRMPDGSVSHGYHADKVLKGELMRPNASNLFEYPEFKDRAGIDPREMEPLSLEPPAMTPEEETVVPLAKAVNAIKEKLNHVERWGDPIYLSFLLTDIENIARKGRA